jgi:methionyl-tRNA synthetase
LGRFYLTTPIYYANDAPHAGSAYTTIAADVLARYHRRLGDDTFFLTGTDEHGAKVAEAAAQRGITPKEFTDQIVDQFKAAWTLLDVTNDYFVRTTDERHKEGVQSFLTDLYERGEIYKGKYEGLYCVGCEAYVSPDDLVDGLCPSHKRPPIKMTEENYFFRLGKYEEALIKAITDESDPNHFEVGPLANKVSQAIQRRRGCMMRRFQIMR